MGSSSSEPTASRADSSEPEGSASSELQKEPLSRGRIHWSDSVSSLRGSFLWMNPFRMTPVYWFLERFQLVNRPSGIQLNAHHCFAALWLTSVTKPIHSWNVGFLLLRDSAAGHAWSSVHEQRLPSQSPLSGQMVSFLDFYCRFRIFIYNHQKAENQTETEYLAAKFSLLVPSVGRFGLREFVVISPGANCEAIISESKCNLLLSSVSMSLTNSGWWVENITSCLSPRASAHRYQTVSGGPWPLTPAPCRGRSASLRL